jgi:hypothetical protein
MLVNAGEYLRGKSFGGSVDLYIATAIGESDTTTH